MDKPSPKLTISQRQMLIEAFGGKWVSVSDKDAQRLVSLGLAKWITRTTVGLLETTTAGAAALGYEL